MREIVVEEGWREKLQDLAARRKQSWPLLLLVAGATAAALAIGGRESSARIAPPAQPPPAVSPTTTSAGAPEGAVYVHVAGAVRQPGLYEFPVGARVADAIETAGGPAAKADLDALNLAELLVDGTKVDVLRRGEAPPVSAGVASAATPAAATSPPTIRLNSADQVTLETIPGIGPVTAAAILKHRDEIGGFRSLEQLLDVDGIGPATFESIRSYVTL